MKHHSDESFFKKLFFKLKFFVKSSKNADQNESFAELDQLSQKFKQSCPGLLVTPRLFKEVMNRSSQQISDVMIANYNNAVRDDPSFLKEIEETKKHWEAYKLRKEGSSHRHHHHDGHLGFGKKCKPTEEDETFEQRIRMRERESRKDDKSHKLGLKCQSKQEREKAKEAWEAEKQ